MVDIGTWTCQDVRLVRQGSWRGDEAMRRWADGGEGRGAEGSGGEGRGGAVGVQSSCSLARCRGFLLLQTGRELTILQLSMQLSKFSSSKF